MQYIHYYFLELRLRGVYAMISICLVLGTWYLYKYELLYLWSRPFFVFETHFFFFEIPEALSILLQMTIFGTLYVILPYGLYSLWQFWVPGMYTYQRRLMTYIGLLSLAMWFSGFFLSYVYVFPRFCEFLLSFEFHSSSVSVEYMPRIDAYMRLVFTFFLAMCGLSQIPVVFCVMFSQSMISWKSLWSHRKLAVCACVLLSAGLSPPDLISQLILSCVIYALYELILLSGIVFELSSS